MSDIATRFAAARQDVQALAERPDNATLLELYALYKQGAEGDAIGERPGMMDFVNRMKFDAWDKLRGTQQEAAQQAYIDLVERLRAG
ncbi:acyl-CoA-binding protein [Laribacter hongkongensis]|uniref:acyl-CoA-binding protein n=1 Tax=Laribacter hongkongensis TaxID=168471 RepID=UPI001EFDC2BC|nr:acyl-CoA-binding protein [Laribacter hongkongensis]MCG8992592.1 acyl-CoA-binding protein [Laribacter hongkongensis]MCG8997121.1 acyl-CoA-binding protein [Laribacter hongkongensis]MCG9001639.1 acyl-CoA-binding protein [Laribacter hongkongensis]MCG9003935.1 acyl-CoA-binding protein [Laribacter hongkongensis]MCG9006510.1 acyl-CoA-binding protein [Laribacter hongkongensis]